MSATVVAWTGHRPDLFLDPDQAITAIHSTARELLDGSPRSGLEFLVGGQRGVDTWAAQAAIALSVPFAVILPAVLTEFTHDWSEPDRILLEQILQQAANVEVASGYTERNRALATGAQLLIAVWTRTGGGGTAETLDLARQAGTPVREIVLPASPNASSAVGRGV